MISWFSLVLISVQLKQSSWKLALLFGKPYGIEKIMSGLFDMELDTTMFLCYNQRFIKMIKNVVEYGTEGRHKTLVCEYR